MTFRLRALRALVLLAGFFQIGVVLLAAMALLDWLLVTRLSTAKAAWFEGAVLTVTILLASAILRGMFTFLRAGRLGPVPHGVAVKPDDQPELWDQVRAAAEATGERPPDELYLVAEVNAGVAEQSRLLGLLPGRRRMLLGLPLLAGLTVPRLRAVLAHEFGHYGNLDTRLGGVIMRGREAVLHTVEMFSGGRPSCTRRSAPCTSARPTCFCGHRSPWPVTRSSPPTEWLPSTQAVPRPSPRCAPFRSSTPPTPTT